MKKVISISIILFATFYFLSCDKVKNPIVKKNTAVGSKFITKSNSAISNFRKTLLEDYTAARCINCPDAADIAKALVAQYGNSLVVVAPHTGDLARPFGHFINQDFRTDAGDAWYPAAGFGITTWPTGLVNRKDYAPNGLLLSRTNWSSVIAIAKNDPFIVKLDVTTNYDTTVMALNTDIKATFKTTYPNPVKLIVVLTEDGIVGIQDDAQGNEIEDYEFEHMLRGSINGNWGADLKTTPIAANDSVKVSYPNFDLKAMTHITNASTTPPTTGPTKIVNDKNVSVVVFAYDATTREVLQVERVKIR